MATTSLFERLGLGNDRAIANARRAQLDRQQQDRLIADLVRAMEVHEALAAMEHRSRSVAA